MWLALWLAGCGAAPPADDTAPAGGGSAATGADGATETEPTEEELMLDPCAEDDPCAVGGVDSEGTALTEPSGAAGEEAGRSAEVQDTGAQAQDPRVAWRNRVGAGRAVFDRACGSCHPDGEADSGPDIRRKRIPVDRVRALIRKGRGRMRPIPARRLPDRYMDELMAYLATIGTVRGVERPE